MILTETTVREVLTYTDAFGTANKTTGRRPGKLVTKTGDGTLNLQDADSDRTTVTVAGGTVTFTDQDLVDQVNADGRSGGDNIANGTVFQYITTDGTTIVSPSLTVSL